MEYPKPSIPLTKSSGENRVIQMLAGSWQMSATELAVKIGSAVEGYTGDRGLFDEDATLLLLQAN